MKKEQKWLRSNANIVADSIMRYDREYYETADKGIIYSVSTDESAPYDNFYVLAKDKKSHYSSFSGKCRFDFGEAKMILSELQGEKGAAN